MAISPIVGGLLGSISIRAVFLLNAGALIVVGYLVSRLMISAGGERTAAPVAEEV